MFSFQLTAATIGLSVLVALPGLAQDTSLYAEAAPEDASFVRFIGFDGAAQATFAGHAIALSADAPDAYVAVSAAQLEGVAPGSYATVLRHAGGQVQTIPEGPRERQAKVHLFMVNATDAALDLRLADNSGPVIEAVNPGSSASRAVNPVQVSLGVFADGSDDALATFDLTLRRGQNVSFVAGPDGVRLIDNQFGPVAR